MSSAFSFSRGSFSGEQPIAGKASPPPSRKTELPNTEQRMADIISCLRAEIRSAVKQAGLTMVRSRFDTSDIVQESLIQIWRQVKDQDIEQLEFTQGLLAVVAKGHARKMTRYHLAKKRTVSREKGVANHESSPASAPEPLEQADIREQIGLMLNAMNFIHPTRQLIVFRRFFDDASFQEIGDEICRPKEWVRQQYLKAQKEIRLLLMHRS